MKFYTIQHKAVYETLVKDGVYFADSQFIYDESFKPAYAWIVEMAKSHIPNWTGETPVWLWTEQPDLRSHRWINSTGIPKKEEHVLMTLEIDPSQVLITDFSLWHQVLNGAPVPFDNKDMDNQKDLTEEEIKTTWERILFLNEDSFNRFDPEFLSDTRQGIVNCLKLSQVIKVKSYIISNRG